MHNIQVFASLFSRALVVAKFLVILNSFLNSIAKRTKRGGAPRIFIHEKGDAKYNKIRRA